MNRQTLEKYDVYWWVMVAALTAIFLSMFFTGCGARHAVATPVVEDYDELSDSTPTQADLNQAAREAIAAIKAHQHGKQ